MTFTFQGNEAAVAAIVAQIQSAIPAEVTAVNALAATVADGYTIAAPLAVLDHVPALETISDFPTVAVENGEGRLEDDTGQNATGVYEFLVVVIDYDSEQQALTRRMRRHVKALGNALTPDSRAISPLWGVNVVGIVYGPSLGEIREDAKKPHAFLSWAGIRLSGRIEEG